MTKNPPQSPFNKVGLKNMNHFLIPSFSIRRVRKDFYEPSQNPPQSLFKKGGVKNLILSISLDYSLINSFNFPNPR
jgi:hypothetical protein